MKRTVFILIGVLLGFGCARVSVQGTEKPIKVDISMRLDVYQHIDKDIDAIENIVSGSDKGGQSLLDCLITAAYAQEEALDPEVEQAALRRKDRRAQISAWQAKGAVGENKSGLLEVRKSQELNASVEELIKAENNDRMVIYKAIAAKNNSSVEAVQKRYVEKYLHRDAPPGTPLEVLNEATGAYEWKIK